MSRFLLAQSKLNDALAALESALALTRATSDDNVDIASSVDSTKLLADLHAVDAKVAKAVDMISSSISLDNDGGETS